MPTTQWWPGATVTLYRVPWDAKYEDVVQFGSADERDAYFASIESVSLGVRSSVYCYPGEPVTVDLPYTEAFRYNYCVVRNPARDTDPESQAIDYYYFITSCTQAAPQPTTLTLQLDTWQQYLFDVEFGTGYYTQGHLPMVNEPCLSNDNIPDTLNRYFSIPEGLDTGPEFQDYGVQAFSLQQVSGSPLEPDYLCIVSTVDLTAYPGTVEEPSLTCSQGAFYDGIFSGCSVYLIQPGTTQNDLADIMRELSTRSWVTQCIVSITSVPRGIVPVEQLKQVGFLFDSSSLPQLYTLRPEGHGIFDLADGPTIKIENVANGGWEGLEAYSDLRKLWCYPYSVVEVGNSQNSVFLKPQLLPANETAVKFLACAVAPYLEAAAVPWGYGCNDPGSFTVSMVQTDGEDPVTYSAQVPYGDLLDTAVWFDDFPQWSIINNSAVVYMASTANTRKYSYDTAGYNRTMAQLEQSTNLSKQLNYPVNPVDVDYLGTAADELRQMAVGTVNSGASAIAGLGRRLGRNWSDQAVQGLAGLAAGSLASQVPVIGEAWSGFNAAVADFNQAKIRREGDYAQAIRGIEAGVADAQLKPPSSVGNTGGQGLRYANALTYSLFIRYKRITPAYVAKLGDYFKRWGYLVNRYIDVPQDLRVCSPCSYWRFGELYLDCAKADETSKEVVRGILESGTTVWDDPRRIGKTKPTDVRPNQDRIATYYT